jgi:hypothetical protein
MEKSRLYGTAYLPQGRKAVFFYSVWVEPAVLIRKRTLVHHDEAEENSEDQGEEQWESEVADEHYVGALCPHDPEDCGCVTQIHEVSRKQPVDLVPRLARE